MDFGAMYEEKHVLAFLITEVFGNSKASESDTSASPGGLVHLTEDQGDFGVTVQLNDLFRQI